MTRALPWRSMVAVLVLVTAGALGQGMPPAARENIHMLFNRHDQVKRQLTLTKDGYEATTESEDADVAKALQAHVQQMQDRLDRGLAARRWDPAFAEFREYYDQIDVKVEKTDTGVKIVARGRTPAAAKVAQNHAKVISEFVQDGWAAHNTKHPAALDSAETAAPAQEAGVGCGKDQGSGQCRMGCQQKCGGKR